MIDETDHGVARTVDRVHIAGHTGHVAQGAGLEEGIAVGRAARVACDARCGAAHAGHRQRLHEGLRLGMAGRMAHPLLAARALGHVRVGAQHAAALHRAGEHTLALHHALANVAVVAGQVGAAPIQNIGAYGQEVSSTISAVEFLDFESGEIGWLKPETLAFGYRTSCFKQGRAGLIIAVEFRFAIGDGLSQPISFSQLAASLGIELGDRAAIADVRQAVLSLRAAKGMVLNPADQDTVSCGSFFQNPVVSHQFARTLPADAPRFETVEDDGLTVKLSAAWLIENAGIPKGFALAGSKAAISSKHTLAITNRGGASADEVVELARFIQERVSTRWGITLVPEPNLVGF